MKHSVSSDGKRDFEAIAWQMKLSDKIPRATTNPDWISNTVLIRGKAPEKGKKQADGWIYPNRNQVLGLIGTSLAPCCEAYMNKQK